MGGPVGAAVGYGETCAAKAVLLRDVNVESGPEALERLEAWRLMQNGAAFIGGTAGTTGGALVGGGCAAGCAIS